MEIYFYFPILLFVHEGLFLFTLYSYSCFIGQKKGEYKNFIPHFFGINFCFNNIYGNFIFFKGSEKSVYEICQSLINYTPIGCLNVDQSLL